MLKPNLYFGGGGGGAVDAAQPLRQDMPTPGTRISLANVETVSKSIVHIADSFADPGP